jgi:hypothetical protein
MAQTLRSLISFCTRRASLKQRRVVQLCQFDDETGRHSGNGQRLATASMPSQGPIYYEPEMTDKYRAVSEAAWMRILASPLERAVYILQAKRAMAQGGSPTPSF